MPAYTIIKLAMSYDWTAYFNALENLNDAGFVHVRSSYKACEVSFSPRYEFERGGYYEIILFNWIEFLFSSFLDLG